MSYVSLFSVIVWVFVPFMLFSICQLRVSVSFIQVLSWLIISDLNGHMKVQGLLLPAQSRSLTS